MEFFLQLGRIVDQEWRLLDYSEEAFPAVASKALNALPPFKSISFWEITKWALTADQLPIQHDINEHFGQPPLTVYHGRDFRIEVLYWIEGVPDIHQHAFSGAFHVLEGSSIHSTWDFNIYRQICTRLALGDLVQKDVEILRAGDTRPIFAGKRLIHSTFHLERPSLTVVVRTLSEIDKRPQYMYLPPGIAYDPVSEIPQVKRRAQLLKMLIKCGRQKEFDEMAHKLIATGDSYSIFQLFRAIDPLIEDTSRKRSLYLAASEKHPELAAALKVAFENSTVFQQIKAMRRRTSDSEVQLFLALLMNIGDRSSLSRLIKEYYSCSDPIDVIVMLVRKVHKMVYAGNDMSSQGVIVFDALLRGKSDTDINEDLKRCPRAESSVISKLDVPQIVQHLREVWFLRALLK